MIENQVNIQNNLVNDYDNHWIPMFGYKWVSDGIIWTDGIYLGKSDSIDRWYGTNEEPPEISEETNEKDEEESE